MAPRSSSRSTKAIERPIDDIVVGVVRAPHGVGGEVRVEPLTDRYEERFREGSELLCGDATLTIGAVRGTASDPIVRFEGVDLARAEALRGLELRIPRERARRAGELLWADLVGRDVVTPGGELLGQVRDVLRAGGADVLVVQGGEREILLPMIGSVIREVGERIVAVPQEEA